MRNLLFLLTFVLIFSCKNSKASDVRTPIEDSDSTEQSSKGNTSGLDAISTKDFREFKVLDSENLTNAEIWSAINPQMEDFKEADYNRLKPFILEQDITQLQTNRTRNKFTYEELMKFYLYRIRTFDRENPLSLNSVIAINPKVIQEAKHKDQEFLNKRMKHPIHGMPILLKDNVNAARYGDHSWCRCFKRQYYR